MILGKITRKSVKLGKWIQNRTGIICIFGVNLRIFHRKNILRVCCTYPQQMYKDLFIIFGIFYLKLGKFYTFFQLGKGQVMGPKISAGKSLVDR